MFKDTRSYSKSEDCNKLWFSLSKSWKNCNFASFIPKQCFIDKYSSFGKKIINLVSVFWEYSQKSLLLFSHEWFEKLPDEDELWLNMLLSHQTSSKEACSCQDLWNDLQFCGWCRHIRKITQKEPKTSRSDGDLRANKKDPPSDFGWDGPEMRELCLQNRRGCGDNSGQDSFISSTNVKMDSKVEKSVKRCFLQGDILEGSVLGIYMVCAVVS